MAAKPAIKLQFYEQRVVCPYCHTNLMFNTPTETIVSAHRTCPKCGKEFLIEKELLTGLGESEKARRGAMNVRTDLPTWSSSA